jgi:electron transfer flavoprotein alpha subunit
VLPATADGRDLAPRLAAALERPLLAGATGAVHRRTAAGCSIAATLARLDDRVLVPARVDGPAVVTLVPAGRTPASSGPGPRLAPLPRLERSRGGGAPSSTETRDAEVLALLPPDLRTMDLGDAPRVLAGGAGLASGGDDDRAVRTFDLLVEVAAALGASAGATRVATDAGWTTPDRQIGITGVTIAPDLYLALGISGAAQHVGGLGDPRHIVSVNTDPSCPMTAMADLGLVTEARPLLEELAARLGVTNQEDSSSPVRSEEEVVGRG